MTLSLTVSAKLGNLSTVREFIAQSARGFSADEDYIYDLVLAVDEAVTNIIVHGYRKTQEATPGNIYIMLEPVSGGLSVIIQDDAPWFDPTSHPKPDLSLPLGSRPRGGMGIHLVRQLTETQEYEAVPDGGNRLRMIKLFEPHHR